MRLTAWTVAMMATGCGIQIGGSDELMCEEAAAVALLPDLQPEHWVATVEERLTTVVGRFDTVYTAGDLAAMPSDTGEAGALTVSIDEDTLTLVARSHPEPDQDPRCDDLVRAEGRLAMKSALVTLDVPVRLRLSGLTTEVVAELDPAAVSTAEPAPAFVTGTFDHAWVDLTAFHHHEAARSDADVGWQGWLSWRAEDESGTDEPDGDFRTLGHFQAGID